jgi:hypothetical protein
MKKEFSGSYVFVSVEEVVAMYSKAGYDCDADIELPPCLSVEGADIFFTDMFVQYKGKTCVVALTASDFEWEDILLTNEEDYSEDDSFDEEANN